MALVGDVKGDGVTICRENLLRALLSLYTQIAPVTPPMSYPPRFHPQRAHLVGGFADATDSGYVLRVW